MEEKKGKKEENTNVNDTSNVEHNCVDCRFWWMDDDFRDRCFYRGTTPLESLDICDDFKETSYF